MKVMGRCVHIHHAYDGLHFAQQDVVAVFHHLEQGPFPLNQPGELSIVFMADAAITRLHADFLGDPTSTDVITFEGDPDFDFAGEICVCVDYALSQAPEYGHSFSEELTLYLVHGWLHLVGFNDIEARDAVRMREAEQLALRYLKEKSAIPIFNLINKC